MHHHDAKWDYHTIELKYKQNLATNTITEHDAKWEYHLIVTINACDPSRSFELSIFRT